MGFAPKIRFAPDSPLEGNGFEPSVPGTKEPVFVAEGELWDRTGAAKKGCFLCGTDGSNPSPSTRESVANLISSIRAPNRSQGGRRSSCQSTSAEGGSIPLQTPGGMVTIRH